MATANDFAEYYKTISNTELLDILENPDQYQPEAVKAAKLEFGLRQLSDEEIQVARQPIVARQLQQDKQKEKVKAIEEKVKAARHTLADTLNPIQPNLPSTEKTIRLTVLVFGGLFVYQLVSGFEMHLAFIKDLGRFPLQSAAYLIPIILLPVAVFTFWKRMTAGWILLISYLTWAVIVALRLLIWSFTWNPSGLTGIDNLFPRPSSTTYIIQLAFFSAVIYILSKKNTREVFIVDKRKILLTIGFSGAIAVVLMFLIS